MSRFKEVKEIYEKITDVVTGSKKEWKDFLTFAARIYKYNFDNAILIYAQRPDATMVANMEIWNRRIERYINRGTRSIAVFDNSKPSLKLEYLFDVKDTNGEPHTIPKLWSLNDNITFSLIDKLNKKYDLSYNDLNGLIGEMVEMKVNANLENSFADFENDTQNTWLQDLPMEGLISCFAQTIIESSHYMVAKRCGIDSPIYNDDNSFRLITHFNTLPLTLRLGNAVCSISQEILREIESEVNLIIREKRSERNNERSISNELQGSRGNILSKDSNIQGQGSRREAIREVWTDGTELSEGKSSEQIQLTFGKGGTDANNEQGEQGSLWETGANNGTDIEDKSNKKSREHHAELQVQGTSETDSRRNSSIGDSVPNQIDNKIQTNFIESLNGGSFLMPENKKDTSNEEDIKWIPCQGHNKKRG